MRFNKGSLYFAVVMAVVGLLDVKDSAAQSNICTEDGGTAECVGPEVVLEAGQPLSKYAGPRRLDVSWGGVV
jgi:hypothetical protein